MAVQEQRASNKTWISVGGGILCLLVAATLLFRTHTEAIHNANLQNVAWYSDDDGASFFLADQRTVMPPFDHNGHPADRAFVFTADHGKTRFVGYLQRFTPDAINRLKQSREAVRAGEAPVAGVWESVQKFGVLVKKPGQSQWVNIRDPRSAAVRDVRGPDGKPAEPVTPG